MINQSIPTFKMREITLPTPIIIDAPVITDTPDILARILVASSSNT